MRMLLKVMIPAEGGNKSIKDGSLPKLFQSTMEELKPEAAYFYTEKGNRAAHFFFDLKETSQMPEIAEPFFRNLNAQVEFIPVMNAQDLKAGLEKAARKF